MENRMSLKRVRIELARTPEFPEGRSDCGYEFNAPLDRMGKIDTEGWARARNQCSVLRFWHNTMDEHGCLVHHRGHRWAFAWPGGDGEETIHRLDKHTFKVDEYVSVSGHDGVPRPFRIVSVESLR